MEWVLVGLRVMLVSSGMVVQVKPSESVDEGFHSLVQEGSWVIQEGSSVGSDLVVSAVCDPSGDDQNDDQLVLVVGSGSNVVPSTRV